MPELCLRKPMKSTMSHSSDVMTVTEALTPAETETSAQIIVRLAKESSSVRVKRYLTVFIVYP